MRASYIFSVLSLVLCSCASKPALEPFKTRIYDGAYEDVWSSALKALSDYPLKLNNKDTGKIQTEVINGPYNDLLFSHPEGIDLPERFRFSMRFNIAKVDEDEEQGPTIRVRVIKDLQRFVDFYTGWVDYPADGVEERLLLYRLEHLLKMEQKLTELASEANKPKDDRADEEEDLD